MKALLLCALLVTSQIAFAGPRVVKNGGDMYAIEFLGIGQQLVKTLADHPRDVKFDLRKLAKAVDETTVESTSKPLTLNGVEKDAINSPTTKSIVFNRITWAGRGDLSKKAVLVLHEYLGIAGISDKKYEISSSLIETIAFGKVNYDGQVFDRKLTKAEMQKVLPAYLSFISAQAKEIPSPEDNSALKQLLMAIKNPTKIIPGGAGEEVYRIQEIKKWAEIRMADLNEITDAQRVDSTKFLLDGFRSSTGRITCELGYSSISRMKNQRIVRCQDDHSQPPSSDDDEGFGDIRTFILSIDDANLNALGVLWLDVFQAG